MFTVVLESEAVYQHMLTSRENNNLSRELDIISTSISHIVLSAAIIQCTMLPLTAN